MPKKKTSTAAAAVKKTAAPKKKTAHAAEAPVNENLQEHAKTPSSRGAASSHKKESRVEVKKGEPLRVALLTALAGHGLSLAGWRITKRVAQGTRTLLNQDKCGEVVVEQEGDVQNFVLVIASADWEPILPAGSYTLTATFCSGATFQGFSTALVVVDEV